MSSIYNIIIYISKISTALMADTDAAGRLCHNIAEYESILKVEAISSSKARVVLGTFYT